MKLAFVRLSDAKERFDAADSHFKKIQIARKFFDEEAAILIDEMKKFMEECHHGKTMD